MKLFNKLVRDNIPEIIEKDGQKCQVRVLDEKEYKEELLKKLIEEAKEVWETNGDRKELIKELGDVLEVVESVIETFDIKREEVDEVKEERKMIRGGFKKKLYLEYIED